MKIHQIKNRYTGAVIFETEAESLKEAVEMAIASYSNLSGSNLRGSDLRGSNLRGSDLRGSNLSGSDLRGSNLRYSNLSGSNLRGSDLSGSNLSGSDLRGSNLSYSDLRYSDLRGSNLRGSDLSGSKGVISITGLPYHVIIWKDQVQAGCKIHTAAEWRKFTARQIAAMDGDKATVFYPRLLQIIDLFCGSK